MQENYVTRCGPFFSLNTLRLTHVPKCERLDEGALSATLREGSREPSVADREEEPSNAKAIRNTVKAILACGAENDKWMDLPRARGVTQSGLEACCRMLSIDISGLVPRTRKSMLAEAVAHKVCSE